MNTQLTPANTRLLKLDGIYFKCEYENPTGSVKDRGIVSQLSHLLRRGIKNIAISSSGNAAISAAFYSKRNNLNLTVFAAHSINRRKFNRLKELGVNILKSHRPVSDCIKYCLKNNTYNLRPSTDPNGARGYEAIALELNKIYPDIDAVFFPVSSGTTLKGVYEGYQKIGKIPKLYAIQTQKIHPIAEVFDTNFISSSHSIVDSIVARYTPRKDEIIKIIKISGGGGYIVSDQQVKKASLWLLTHGVSTSYEGALSLAGLWKAKKNGQNFNRPVCLLTGKKG